MKSKQKEQTLDVFEEAISDEVRSFNSARARIQGDIESIERHENPYDPNSEAESRNEILFLERELSDLEKKHQDKIQSLKVEKKQK